MTVDDLDLLSNEDLPKKRKRREHGWKSRRAVYDPVWQMIDLEPVGKVSDSTAVGIVVCVRDDYYSMASVDQFLLGNQLAAGA